MSYLLGMSFDLAASPSLALKAPQQRLYQHRQPFGWGIAWYPAGDQAAVVIKDPTSVQKGSMTQLLKDWQRFRASVFLSHIQGAAKRRTQQDTHPFSRSYARRTWLIAHTGDLVHDFQKHLPMDPQPAFEPIGRTDSEYVFCWLLSRAAQLGARNLSEIGWERLHGWFAEVNQHGTANFMLTDGQDLVVYRDKDSFGTLFWNRRRPPHSVQRLENEALVLDLDDPVNANQTMCLFSTTPLTDDPSWLPIESGHMMVARRGALSWASANTPQALLDQALEQQRAPALPQSPPQNAETPAPSQQPAQNQTPTASPLPMTAVTEPGDNNGNNNGSDGDQGLPPDGGDMAERHRVRPAFLPEPRILRVTHETTYAYANPIEMSTHTLRFKPVHDHHQQILEHTLEIDPMGVYSAYEDVFGNQTARLDFEAPYTTMRTRSHSVVRLTVPTRLAHSFTNHHDSIPLVWMPWHRDMMHPYLLPSELPVSQLRELSDYAMSFVERQDHDLIETLLDINQTIYRDYAYVPGSTNLATTPFEVYANRRGVCQDFANLFICLARLLNIPARYRVGYIHTGANYDNTIQSEASHAWAELYLPLTGWRGFDPTNGCLASQDHIRVACGRNYRDATPTSGTIYRGGGGETLNVDVRVEDITDQYPS